MGSSAKTAEDHRPRSAPPAVVAQAVTESLSGVEVVAEAGDGREALRLMGEQRPDLALLDISMPGMNGIEATARGTKTHPRVRIVILSMHADAEYVRASLRAGAAGYLLKSADRSELELAIRAVGRGEAWLSPVVARTVATAFTRSDDVGCGPFEILTARQREILQLIAEGLSTKGIAARLRLGVKTVEAHRTELMERLDIHGVAGLVRYAIRVGLVRPES